MSSSSSSAVVSADTWTERSVLDGMMIASVGYGVHLTLFFLCFNILVSRPQKTRRDWLQLGYICTLFSLGTVGNALDTRWCELLFVDDVASAGDPSTIQYQDRIVWIGNSIYIVNTWFQDGLLLYRFFVIWRHSRHRTYAILFPAIMFLVSIVLGCLLIAQLNGPLIHFSDSGVIPHLAITYWSISIALNTILTIAIAGKLLLVRWRMRSSSGSGSTPYVSVSAMLIESAALYTINGIILVVSIGLGSEVQNLAIAPLGQTQSIAPLMIIYRVLQGRAWSGETSRTLDLSPLQFSHNLSATKTSEATNDSLRRSEEGLNSNVTLMIHRPYLSES